MMIDWVLSRLGSVFLWLGMIMAIVMRDPIYLVVSLVGLFGAFVFMDSADLWEMRREADRIEKRLKKDSASGPARKEV